MERPPIEELRHKALGKVGEPWLIATGKPAEFIVAVCNYVLELEREKAELARVLQEIYCLASEENWLSEGVQQIERLVKQALKEE